MPRFSVVVPAYKVQGYLRACLDSVLTQSHTDLEVIAVDDCSPDGCGRIMDEFAARDSRVTAVHLERNVGLGPARNAGMDRACGDYLLFLDGDDTYAPGALEALAQRLDQTGDPDVLLFDYARTWWWGKVQRNRMAPLLQQSDPEVFTARERPELLDLLMVVWNKAYRADFVARHGFSFPPGYYEDTPWTFPVMLSAERIACLDRVCVHYRQRRQGNILRTPSRRHFDVFDQYDRVFAFLGSRPQLAVWHPFLYRKMTEHVLDVLAKPQRVPQESRREFFHQATSRYRLHRPPGHRFPVGVTGLKQYLVLQGAYPAFEALKATNKGHRALRRRSRKLARRLDRRGTRVYYRAQLRRPIDENLALYSAYWGKGYVCNPAAVHACAQRLAPQVRGVLVVSGKQVGTVPPGVEHVVAGTRQYWRMLARAKYTFNNVNFDNQVVKRPGTVHVQTQHGTPLKHMGIDQIGYPAAARRTNFGRMLTRSDRWDYCLSSNRHSSEIWEQAYPCGFEILEYGYPRNDVFYTARAEDVLGIRDALGIAPGRTAVLYAPTHRDYSRDFTPRIDIAGLCSALGPDFLVLLRAHHSYAESPEVRRLGELGCLLDVSAHRSVEELCLAADALLTDYSSIMFDYANLDRPIVVHADDWETYRATRGVYFDLLAAPPGPVTTTDAELVEVFRSGAWRDRRSAELRAAFRERFCEFDDGHAAERVVLKTLCQQDDVPPVMPLEDRTPAPSPTEALRLAAAARGPLAGADDTRPAGSGGPQAPAGAADGSAD
ncbi:glycosyl transferase [Wenjunlia vitaminophila]|uniref:Glycosyl transferase n=1 Tax=Wenjunlia vitaminophila TaxID=76728 RepID=A0A0T6LNJ0_WENVI|nr:bifunctional glycosyltransferase/CDP-glycerol:glycerophosphate glycerophosphotransferase [Wenjunlia vitaminophila]KRV47664.1 glycosyl transferase [Wenjunlia vitaminophila]